MTIVEELKQVINTFGGESDGVHTIPEAIQVLKSLKPPKQTWHKKATELSEE